MKHVARAVSFQNLNDRLLHSNYERSDRGRQKVMLFNMVEFILILSKTFVIE